jgi:hypothetical protein
MNAYKPYEVLAKENEKLKADSRFLKEQVEIAHNRAATFEKKNEALERQLMEFVHKATFPPQFIVDPSKVGEWDEAVSRWREKHAETAKELRLMRAARNYWHGLYQAREESFQEVSEDRDLLLDKVKRLNKQCQAVCEERDRLLPLAEGFQTQLEHRIKDHSARLAADEAHMERLKDQNERLKKRIYTTRGVLDTAKQVLDGRMDNREGLEHG